MKDLGALIDKLDAQFLAAVLAANGLALGVALVFSPGWGLIVLSALVLAYVILPDQRSRT